MPAGRRTAVEAGLDDVKAEVKELRETLGEVRTAIAVLDDREKRWERDLMVILAVLAIAVVVIGYLKFG
jgi:hypothetical protein